MSTYYDELMKEYGAVQLMERPLDALKAVCKEADRLRDENARLRLQLEACRVEEIGADSSRAAYQAQNLNLQSKLSSLTAEAEKLRGDGERLDWLASKEHAHIDKWPVGGYQMIVSRSRQEDVLREVSIHDLRAAIDAARQADAAKGKTDKP
jgi:hypothetical protein